MAYEPQWSNQNESGRVVAGEHFIKLTDVDEIINAINRRWRLTYRTCHDFSSALGSGQWISRELWSTATYPPFDNMRKWISYHLMAMPGGVLGGEPPSPGDMNWLWPINDGDENKIIVAGTPGSGQVNLFNKLNGTTGWTDPTLTAGVTDVRAVHLNELRQSIEWLRRGRWHLPIYFSAGILSWLPDTPMYAGLMNNGTDELRTLGFAFVRNNENPPEGLVNLTARSTSKVVLVADGEDCTVALYRCKRPIDFIDDRPTWNEYLPQQDKAWSQAGGLGGDDAEYIGSVELTDGVEGKITGSSLASAIQAMIDGEPGNFTARRTDESDVTVDITGELIVEFDLDTPPN